MIFLNMLNNILVVTLLLSFAVQIFFFTFAASFKTDKVTDLSYGLTFIILAIYSFFEFSIAQPIQILVLVLVVLWGLRISAYLLVRIIKTGKDKRFDGIREKFWAFAKFWFFQAISVWIIMLPAITILGTKEQLSIKSIYIGVGTIIWLLGLGIEGIADIQKYIFKSNPTNKNRWIETGIWKYSRHPNYFGEMLCWWGIFILIVPVLQGLNWLIILGPLYITFILLFISGIPPLEKRANEKFGKDPKYLKYKKRTSLLVPLPKKS